MVPLFINYDYKNHILSDNDMLSLAALYLQ